MITNGSSIVQELYKISSTGTSLPNGMQLDPLAHDYPVVMRPMDEKRKKE
jgi:hypothetical protein